MVADMNRLVESAARQLDVRFKKECEEHICREHCDRQFCEEWPCDVASHEIRTLRLAVWREYVRMN